MNGFFNKKFFYYMMSELGYFGGSEGISKNS